MFAKYGLLSEGVAVLGRRPVDSLSVDDLSNYRESWRNLGR